MTEIWCTCSPVCGTIIINLVQSTPYSGLPVFDLVCFICDRYFVLYQNLLFYYECERSEKPCGVAFLESSYCEPIVNLKSNREERTGGQQGVSYRAQSVKFPCDYDPPKQSVSRCQISTSDSSVNRWIGEASATTSKVSMTTLVTL